MNDTRDSGAPWQWSHELPRQLQRNVYTCRWSGRDCKQVRVNRTCSQHGGRTSGSG